MERYDIVVVGAGTAGMPCAIEAVATGARVLVVEAQDQVGGTLHVSLGQLSGAGSALQAERGISDSAKAHMADIERINRGTGRRDILELTLPRQGATIDWLMENGFDMDPVCPTILHLHEAYREARTYWGVEGGISVLKVLTPLFDAAMAKPNATLMLSTKATGLKTDGGRVAGVTVEGPGCTREIATDIVVLATGGYGSNAQLFARLTGGQALYTAAMPGSDGSGIEIAEQAGAALRGQDLFLPTYAGIPEKGDGNRVIWRHMPSLTPQVRQPWELHLTTEGRRFVREDDPSVDNREHALAAEPDMSFWCVFDDAIQDKAPALLPGWTAAELAAAWNARPDFVTAPDLATLADRTEMKSDALAESLAAYNDACTGASADPMGRTHLPQAIAGPGFRAIRMRGMVLKTPAGLDVDQTLTVRRTDGTPITGLHAVGEAIGGSTLSGRGFISGMSVTPALTLGRWLGRTLGQSPGARKTESAA
ncbi:FAD-dependent oxidoreductase [Chachezhania sediminis]|uniref:FAD-dependent oxidoreductase n=1 Tax=Chachezhania sediminis TaxID=2599291 RepID=UPI00131DBF4C|nr:FAD-dependent oxidoreductase [Chachezhania sediminis]